MVALLALPSVIILGYAAGVLLDVFRLEGVTVIVRIEVVFYLVVALVASLLRAGAHTKPKAQRQLWDWWGKWLGVAATGVAVTFAIWAFEPVLG